MNQTNDTNKRIAEKCKRDLYVIVKRGLYYRPNAHGYTRLIEEAWQLPLEEAKKHEAYVDRPDVPYDDKVLIQKVPVPNYTESLDAMAEAEKTFTDEEHKTFRRELRYITGCGASDTSELERDERAYISATAAQRAAAFLAVVEGRGEQP